MAKPLNFNNTKKRYLNVTLPDGETIMVGMPSKRVMGELLEMKDDLDGLKEADVDMATLDDIYRIVGEILSRNKAGVKVTTEQVEEFFDIDDLIVFFNAYVAFIGEVTGSKN